MQQQRIQYIDSLRGFTMLLVVYSHVVVALFMKVSPVNEIFITFRMPLFFFISGFLSYAVYDKELIHKRTKNRLLYQLLPTIVTSTLFFMLFPMSKKTSLFHEYPQGYWFTYVMVAVFLGYMGIMTLMQRMKKWRHDVVMIVVMIMIYVVREIFARMYGATAFPGKTVIWNLLSYSPYFIFGLLCKEYQTAFFRIIGNIRFILAAVAAYIALYILDIQEVSLRLMGFLGILVVFRIFQYFGKALSSEARLGRILSNIGKHTLEIYLLHYFFIQLLRPLFRQHKDWRQMIGDSMTTELLGGFGLALAIVALCLGIAAIIRKSPALHILMLGRCEINKKHLLWNLKN